LHCWVVVIERLVKIPRIAELDGGAVKTIPWAEVRRRLAARRCPSSRWKSIRSQLMKAAERWYRERNETAAARFRRELDSAVDRIAERPEVGAPYLENSRRILLRRFHSYVAFHAPGPAEEEQRTALLRRGHGRVVSTGESIDRSVGKHERELKFGARPNISNVIGCPSRKRPDAF
jgi:plasmid stabilization system protein ParE